MKFYTGIGSRQTPDDILDLMYGIAAQLDSEGYTLRSGAADGADASFEAGATVIGVNRPEIWLPWKGFNGHPSPLLPSPAAFELAAKYHPAWNRCSHAAKKLHARNGHQVLGADLNTPSEFVICWTPGASGSGGTGQAIRIARAYGIFVFDLANEKALKIWS